MTEQTTTGDSKGRVLKFKPRGSLFARPRPQPSPVEDLSKFESGAEPDDYRHRMIMNIAGFAAAIVIVAVGVWIANSLAQLRKNQDCVISGSRNCTPINIPASPRP